MIVTIICAGLSTILMVLSVASEHWLQSKELFAGDRASLDFLPNNFTGHIFTATNFGLWRACSQWVGKYYKLYKCAICHDSSVG